MKILSFSHCLPFDGIPHAGGEYYLRHVRALLELGHEVTLVVPATAANIGVRPPAGVRVVLVRERTDRITRTAAALARMFRYARMSPSFTRSVVADRQILQLVRDADLLEYQWVPASSLHRQLLRSSRVIRPAACVAHDVVAQSLQRWAEQPGASPIRRILRRLRVHIGRWDEGRQLRGVDLVMTFSEKDRLLLQQYAVRPKVVDPPLADKERRSSAHDRTSLEPVLLYVGAFERHENVDAAEWLLRDIWPTVKEECPGARLALVGPRPSEAMKRYADEDPRVDVTGYVADLAPVYDSAALAVIPLRLGAGVKFKVVTAILQGLPVITTTLGAEGVQGPADHFFVDVEDDAAGIARAIVDHLRDPAPGMRIASMARERASERYGWPAFRHRLDLLYREAAAGRAAPSIDADRVVAVV